ncbi:MAG TPA: Holliday junction resolvase RuvX [Casimicrobiaceae bacterium]|nr:Holliday junction resolvase RuvX [Casimicrobiaceae bacterium]
MRSEADATILAFDFGTRRIGVAIGNTLTRSARALTTIDARDESARLATLDRIVREWEPTRLVVGLPVHADGSEHAMTTRARTFAATLAARYALPVELEDERHTSEIARDALVGGGRDARARRDEVAAQIILQAYLDTHDA